MSSPPSTQQQSAAAPNFMLFTTPLPLSSLDAQSRHCSICREPYGEYAPNTNLYTNTTQAEWAVRVDVAASQDGGSRCCGHVFGRRCLEKHLRSFGAWHNKCPICRAVWFTYVDSNATTTTTTTTTTAPATASVQPRVPWMSRSVLRNRNRELRSEISDRGRLQRSAGFMQQVLDAFEIKDGSREVRASVEEVESTLERLYQNLEREESRG